MFVQYFLITGLGGALLQTLIWVISLLFLPQHAASLGLIPIVGASGALFGLFMAYGMIFGDAYFLAFFVVPIKAKYFVMIMGGLELLSSIYYGNEGVAHLVHIGGLAAGYFYLKIKGKNLKGRGGGGGGSFFGRKKGMSKEEVRRRLSVITNENDKGDKGLPITWN
jgi:membrane associated rhomboid family serine protease